MIKIIDTHAHYNDKAFDDDRDEVITSLFADNVEKAITIGYSLESSKAACEIAKKYSQMYAAVGVHPEDCYSLPGNYLVIIEELTRSERVVAIGEIGLDYHYEGYDKEKQIKCFKEQLELAQKLSLPVIVHTRDAMQDTLDILHEYKPKGVVHCFPGGADTAKEITSLGMMISFTGVLTFKNARKAVEAVNAVPIEKIMLETDCPYMAPVPHRGERNHSGLVPFIAEKLAELKGLTVDETIKICNNNAIEFFNLK